MEKKNCNLSLETKDDEFFNKTCDGCNNEISIGEKYIWGIKSCCGGGCARQLCKNCIGFAASLLGHELKKSKGDKSK